MIYCLTLHPLAKYPGPFWAKFSVWPSYYHTFRGDRHIWIWQCHQLYGSVFRYCPNGIVFNSPKANRDIYESKANVKKGIMYDTYPRKTGSTSSWNCTDKVKHARKRRILNAAFSEKALKSSERYIVQHTDRWCELLLDDGNHGWSSSKNMADWSDRLVFDILGESQALRRIWVAPCGLRYLIVHRRTMLRQILQYKRTRGQCHEVATKSHGGNGHSPVQSKPCKAET